MRTAPEPVLESRPARERSDLALTLSLLILGLAVGATTLSPNSVLLGHDRLLPRLLGVVLFVLTAFVAWRGRTPRMMAPPVTGVARVLEPQGTRPSPCWLAPRSSISS